MYKGHIIIWLSIALKLKLEASQAAVMYSGITVTEYIATTYQAVSSVSVKSVVLVQIILVKSLIGIRGLHVIYRLGSHHFISSFLLVQHSNMTL